MQIEYLGNTAFLVELRSGERIALDWWFSDNAFHGAWALFPPLSDEKRHYLMTEKRPDYVFVSHLHTDHLDPEVLGALDPETPVIIGKRALPHLNRSLRSLGLKNIVEVPFEQEWPLDSFSVVLFDDFANDADAPTDQVGYQLDSAILIRDGDGISFLNLNDNIPTRQQTERVASKFGCPSSVAMVCSSASSYPQCMVHYDDAEKAEKRKALVEKTAQRFVEAVSGLTPQVAIPCGGVVLNGVLAPLTHFAQLQPDMAALDKRHDSLPESTEVIAMKMHDRLDLGKDGSSLDVHDEEQMSLVDALTQAGDRALDHERICVPDSFRVIFPNMLRRARQNLWRRQEALKLYPDWLVTLKVEPLGTVQPHDTVGARIFTYTFDLASPDPEVETEEGRQRIEFIIDARLLLMVLISGTVWDNVYTASLVKTRREPDVFDPNVTKLMSFFAI